MLLERARHRQHDVARGANVEAGPAVGQPGNHHGILHRAHAVEDSVRVEEIQGVDNALGSGQFSGMGHGQQPGSAGDAERVREWCRWVVGLVAVEAESHDTVSSPRGGQVGELEGFGWSTIAVGSNDEPKADPVLVPCGAAGVERDVDDFGVGPEASANQSGPHRRLDPHGPLPGTVFDDLSYQAAEVLLRP